MVVTDLILSIIKNLYLILFFLFVACSKPQKERVETKVKPSVPQAEKVIFGPQNPKKQTILKNETKKFGLDKASGTHFYAVHLNQDKYIDLVVLPNFYSVPEFYTYSEKKNQFIPLKNFPFKEVIKASFLEFSDFNRDNIVDVLLISLNQRSALRPQPPKLYLGEYLNGEINFKKHPFDFPVDSYSSVTSFDFNKDGLLDIYFGNWFDVRSNPPKIKPNRFYMGVRSKGKNFGGFSFRDVSGIFRDEWKYNSSNQKFVNASPTFGVGLCDLNFDGRPELFNANTTGFPNKLWSINKVDDDIFYLDQAQGTQIAGDQIGSHLPKGGGHTFYLNCHDYNQDGFFDIAVGELFHSYDLDIKDRSSILTGANNAPKYEFLRTEYHQDDGTLSWDQGDRRSLWADLDANDRIDLIVDNSGFPPKSRLVIFKQHDDRSFEDISKDWGVDHLNPSGTITIDIGHRQRLDLLSGQTNIRNSKIPQKIYVYRNHASLKNKQRLVIDFDSFSRGQSFEIVYGDDRVEKVVIQSTNGPQSSQSQNRMVFYSHFGNFKKIIVPNFGENPQEFSLRKYRKNKVIQLSFCDRKVQLNTCPHF